MRTETLGKSMFRTDKDASITTCGLLNNIIGCGKWPPEMWPTLLRYALNVHHHGTRKALGLSSKPPEWKGSNE